MPGLGAFLSFAVIASAALFSGQVIDQRTGAPIPNAEVTLVGHRGSVRTDVEGRFHWPGAPALPLDIVVILADGRVSRPIQVTSPNPAVDVILRIESAVTESVTVAGAAPTIDIAPGASTMLLTSADVELRHPSTLVQALETVPGIGVVSEGQAAVPAIRGFARGRTLILVDGNRASTERRAGANAAFLDPETIRTVEIARGPGSVAYGSDAFGGVIAARTRGPDFSNGLRGRLSGSIGGGIPEQGGHLEVSAGYGSGGVLVGVRTRNFDDYRSPAGVIANSGWRDRGVRVRWDHGRAPARWSVAWQTDLGRNLGRPRSDSDVMRLTSPFEDSHRLSAGYERAELGGFQHVRVDGLLALSQQRTDQVRLPTGGRPRNIERADLTSRDVQLRATAGRTLGQATLHIGADLQGRYGMEATDTTIAYDQTGGVISERTIDSIESAGRTAVGVFSETDIEVRRGLRISAGLRVDAVRSTNHGGFFGDKTVSNADAAGLVAATVAPARGLTVTGQVARGFREPILSDRFYRGPVGRGFIQGNPELEPETSLQFDLAARVVAGRARLALAGYHYRINNLIERYASGQDLFLFRNRSRAVLRGAEIEAHVRVARGLALEASGALSRGRDAGDRTPLDDIAPGSGSVALLHSFADRLTAHVRLKAFARHGAAGPSEVSTSAYSLLDGGVSYRLKPQLELRAVLRNILNDAYQSSSGPRWVWAPGRHGSATFVARF